jgi:hypothetical protein
MCMVAAQHSAAQYSPHLTAPSHPHSYCFYLDKACTGGVTAFELPDKKMPFQFVELADYAPMTVRRWARGRRVWVRWQQLLLERWRRGGGGCCRGCWQSAGAAGWAGADA